MPIRATLTNLIPHELNKDALRVMDAVDTELIPREVLTYEVRNMLARLSRHAARDSKGWDPESYSVQMSEAAERLEPDTAGRLAAQGIIGSAFQRTHRLPELEGKIKAAIAWLG